MGTWKELIQSITSQAEFNPPATMDDITHIEAQLCLKLPESLKSLLLETDGIYLKDQYLNIVWSVEEIGKLNQWYRSDEKHAELFMTFDSLLCFAGAGVDGILFAFPVTAKNEVVDHNIIAWDPNDDSRPVVAFSLADYLKQWISGELKF